MLNNLIFQSQNCKADICVQRKGRSEVGGFHGITLLKINSDNAYQGCFQDVNANCPRHASNLHGLTGPRSTN